MIPLMSITRNFFLGSEPTIGRGPFRRFDIARANAIVREELARIGIDIRDPTSRSARCLAGAAVGRHRAGGAFRRAGADHDEPPRRSA